MDRTIRIASVMLGIIIALIWISAFAGCSPCKPGVMACVDQQVKLCDKNGNWKQVMDCRNIQPRDRVWHCCCYGGKCACIPRAKQ